MLIDLSQPIRRGMPVFPGDPPVRIEPRLLLPRDGANVAELSLSTHAGTHVDAPRHLLADGAAVDRLPLERFYGPAAMVDLAPGGRLDPGAVIRLQDLLPHAAALAEGGRVVLRTGWDAALGRAAYFADYPRLEAAAIEWLADRGLWLLGLDTPSPCPETALHARLSAVGTVLLEGLVGLARLPPRFVLAAFPLAIDEGDGAPVRAVAIV